MIHAGKYLLMLAMSLIIVGPAYGSEQDQTDRFLHKAKLSTGMTVVVADGDFEPRSIGSYSVRIYGANPKYPTDDFLSGEIRSRDGYVEKVVIQDINRDDSEEIIVIVRSAGTGGYLSAEAFRYRFDQLKLIISVADLQKHADPIQELTKRLKTINE